MTTSLHDETMADLALDDAGSSWINTFEALDPKSYLHGFLSQQVRSDGRLFHSSRPTRITTSVLTRNAAGSALVRLGATQILAAVSLQVGQPAAGNPNQGDLVVVTSSSSSLSLQASTSTRMIPTTWLQRVLCDSAMVDTTDLAIVEGQSAWRLQIVILCLNDDGNIADASLLAAVAALTDTTLPMTQVDTQGVVHVLPSDEQLHRRRPLLLTWENIPIPLTVILYHPPSEDNTTHILVDPTNIEQEHVANSTLTLVVNYPKRDILNVDLQGSLGVSSKDLALVSQMAFGRAQELEPLLRRP